MAVYIVMIAEDIQIELIANNIITDNTCPYKKMIFFSTPENILKVASSFNKHKECTNNGHCGKASKILSWINRNHKADMLGCKTIHSQVH